MNQFKIHIRYISEGWCGIELHLNDQIVGCEASYLGPNPLDTLVDACQSFYMSLYDEGEEFGKLERFVWKKEPGSLRFEVQQNRNGMLSFEIKEYGEGKVVLKEWHGMVPFKDFLEAIVSEGFRVLNAFGLYGYRAAWMGHTDFPLSQLLLLTGKMNIRWNGNCCCTDLSKEVECLSSYVEERKIEREVHYGECTLYYESWQIQCCGEPFAVGEKVTWTCIIPSEFKNAHGIIVDFEEEHHGFATHSITGIVDKIIAERSEFPKGKRIVHYHEAKTIKEEILEANGYESELKDDEATERTFWGYIVTLRDAMVKPLANDKIVNNI